ncbi:hypothetical protein PMAYCL1PPCAC_05243, partial [Pristionchus mayeri]
GISLCIFLTWTMRLLSMISYFYFLFISLNVEGIRFVVYIMSYTSDVFSLGPGIYSVLVPGPIRRRCLSQLTCGRLAHKKSGVTTVGSLHASNS